MTAGGAIEIVPGRISRPAVAFRVDQAASRIRADLAAGRGSIVVDETGGSSLVLQEMMQGFGVPRAERWGAELIEDPRGAADRLRTREGSASPIADRHLAHSLRRMSTERPPIVVVINPLDESPASIDAARLGADVYMLPRRRTSLPQDVGTVVPWRRAIDLTPLLAALRPPDAVEWRQEYRSAAPEYNRAPGQPVANRIVELPTFEPVMVVREVPGSLGSIHLGGRLTLATFALAPIVAGEPEPWRAVAEPLGISPAQLRDPDEWVVGGTMIRHDRALQVTRGDADGELRVQLVWGGPDPRGHEIARIEEELDGILNSR